MTVHSVSVSFTATNDNLAPLSEKPYFSGGSAYVPSSVFANFGIRTSYFQANNTIMMYDGTREIFFDWATGTTFDSNRVTYYTSAMHRNGTVYVPVAWVCIFFGLSYSFISGNGSGDVLRIKNGSEVLTDHQFINAASSLMSVRYSEFVGTPDPPSPIRYEDRSDTYVSLCLIGLPSACILDIFDTHGIRASFFVTAEDVDTAPDTIRRIAGSGHSIGIFFNSSPENEYAAAMEAIFNAARIRPMLMTSPSSISYRSIEFGEKNAMAYVTPQISLTGDVSASYIISSIGSSQGNVTVFITITDDLITTLPSVLQFLATNNFSVLPMRETIAQNLYS